MANKIIETGAASIFISLEDGTITVTHGTDHVVLHEIVHAEKGSWGKLWDTIKSLRSVDDPEEDIKEFFWKDESGRGFNNMLTEDDLVQALKDQENWDGQTVKDWIEEDRPDVGDTWENTTNHITRIK